MIDIVSHVLVLILSAAGPALAQQAEVTLVCDYVRTESGGGTYAPAFSATYHLSDGSWSETPTAFWKVESFHSSDGDASVRTEIDRATAIATRIRTVISSRIPRPPGMGPGPYYQSGQCRKFEGRQF